MSELEKKLYAKFLETQKNNPIIMYHDYIEWLVEMANKAESDLARLTQEADEWRKMADLHREQHEILRAELNGKYEQRYLWLEEIYDNLCDILGIEDNDATFEDGIVMSKVQELKDYSRVDDKGTEK